MGQIHRITPASSAPTFDHTAAAFDTAYTAGPGAWAPGTAKKYRETFAALAGRLPGPAADRLAALDTEAGRAALKNMQEHRDTGKLARYQAGWWH